MHKHHIIPRHMGGTDDPSNIIELSVEEHAEAHRVLYEKYGKREDYIAWKGLSGNIGKEDIHREKSALGGLTTDKRRKEQGLPPNFHRADEQTLFEWRSKAGSVSTNAKAIWWSNGKEYKFCIEQPDGYIKSAAPNNPGKATKNSKWWNDGVKHKRSADCPGEGWVQGRINSNKNLGGARRKGI